MKPSKEDSKKLNDSIIEGTYTRTLILRLNTAHLWLSNLNFCDIEMLLDMMFRLHSDHRLFQSQCLALFLYHRILCSVLNWHISDTGMVQDIL